MKRADPCAHTVAAVTVEVLELVEGHHHLLVLVLQLPHREQTSGTGGGVGASVGAGSALSGRGHGGGVLARAACAQQTIEGRAGAGRGGLERLALMRWAKAMGQGGRAAGAAAARGEVEALRGHLAPAVLTLHVVRVGVAGGVDVGPDHGVARCSASRDGRLCLSCECGGSRACTCTG